MNWPVIIIVSIAAIALLVFLIIRNQKDEKDFEDQLNNDYPKPKKDKADVVAEEDMK
jgi:low affinity Fe/Cu permease